MTAAAFDFFRWAHIFAGFLSLFLFWIPIVVPKGGRIHNRVGWAYVYAMGLVAVSALYMALYRIFLDPTGNEEQAAFAWFLLFISILSSSSGWYGLRVLRVKNRREPHRGKTDLFIPALLVLSGVLISIKGFAMGIPLLQYFPILGLLLGGSQLYYWLTVPKLRGHWIIEHIGGMLGCCIATVTAFTVFGAPRLLNIESNSILVWFIPTLLLTPVIIGFSRHYRNKFNPPSTKAKAEA